MPRHIGLSLRLLHPVPLLPMRSSFNALIACPLVLLAMDPLFGSPRRSIIVLYEASGRAFLELDGGRRWIPCRVLAQSSAEEVPLIWDYIVDKANGPESHVVRFCDSFFPDCTCTKTWVRVAYMSELKVYRLRVVVDLATRSQAV